MNIHHIPIVLLTLCIGAGAPAQDTFSIVAVDTVNGEVGSAGASCVDLFSAGITDIGFLGDLLPGLGAINTQAAYYAANQANARTRMLAGDSPTQIVAWLQANDAQGVANASNRQYGVVKLVGSGSEAAAHTGTACITYANHRVGANYSIQGNILLGAQILDSMEYRFNNTSGSLAQKLMSALQGANVIGADTRCDDNNSSSLFAFLKVSAPGDPDGDPYLSLGVRTHDGAALEPIDSLQIILDAWVGIAGLPSAAVAHVFPDPATTEVVLTLPAAMQRGEVRLLDAAGRRMPAVAVRHETAVRVNVEALGPGLYHLLWVADGATLLRARFIKE